MQYVGSMFTPFRTRFNNYKLCSRRFDKGELVNQADFSGIFRRKAITVFLRMLHFRLLIGCLGILGLRKVFGSLNWILLHLRGSMSD